MFGFLRRKKAAPDAAPPSVDAGAPPPAADGSTPAVPTASPAPAEVSAPASGPADAPQAAAPGASGRADASPVMSAPPGATEPAPRSAPAPAPATSGPTGAPSPTSAPAEPEAPPARAGWMARLKQGLSKTRTNLAGLFVAAKIDDALYEELETALLTSDAGVETTTWLLESLRTRVRQGRLTDASQVRDALKALLTELLAPLERPIDIDRATPLVMMIAGVNGAGKTTSIGKLAHHLQHEGKTILLAAGDTFRAAAREQLAEWGLRNGVQVIAQQGGDPAAVAFDAVSAGLARQTGVVMIDTAGRLPTQLHLMDELRKVRRVLAKAMPDAPHECLLVLDGNTGQNMLAQVKSFDEAIGLTGLIVTKLDGTAKGGALAALAHTRRERPIPVYFIGVGEAIEDLQAFSAAEFASALLD
ncbi:MAG: signal recognition particle-docking protein FtsY [Burkholderiaceae bacterium]